MLLILTRNSLCLNVLNHSNYIILMYYGKGGGGGGGGGFLDILTAERVAETFTLHSVRRITANHRKSLSIQ